MDGVVQAEPSTKRATLKDLLGLSGPVIVSRLCIMTMGVVDTIVVGHFSTTQLASLSLGWAATSPVLVCGIGLLQGVLILASRYFGAGDMRSAAGVLRQAIRYSAIIGVAFGALIIVSIHSLLSLLQQPAELRQTAADVAVVLSFSLPLFMVGTAASFFLEALGRPTPVMVAMILANIVNLALNLWLVSGGFGVTALGAVGSALATAGARLCLTAALLAYIFWGPHARAFGVRMKAAPSGHLAGEMRRIGYASGLSQLAEAGAFASMSFIAGWSGALAVASFAIVLNLASVAFMVPMGLATAAGVLTSQAVGGLSPKNAMHATWLGLRTTFVVCLAIECVIALTPGLIASAYTPDPALRAAAGSLLLLSALFIVPDGLQVVTAGCLRSNNINWFPTISHLGAYGLVMIPLGIWLSWGLKRGAEGLVQAIIVASFLSAAVLILRLVWLAQTLRRAHG